MDMYSEILMVLKLPNSVRVSNFGLYWNNYKDPQIKMALLNNRYGHQMPSSINGANYSLMVVQSPARRSVHHHLPLKDRTSRTLILSCNCGYMLLIHWWHIYC